jgi:hypothetical protein
MFFISYGLGKADHRDFMIAPRKRPVHDPETSQTFQFYGEFILFLLESPWPFCRLERPGSCPRTRVIQPGQKSGTRPQHFETNRGHRKTAMFIMRLIMMRHCMIEPWRPEIAF